VIGLGPSREGLATLWAEAARAAVPLRSLGVVRPDGPDHVGVTFIDAFGVLACRYRTEEVIEAVRPRPSGRRRVTAAELEARPDAVIEARLLLTGRPEEIRRSLAVRQAFTLPIPGLDPPGILVIGLGLEEAPTPVQTAAIDALASRAAELLPGHESPEAERQRLRRLEEVDVLLPALFRVLDIREVFDRVSALTRNVLPHDILGLYNEDLTQLTVYSPAPETTDIARTRYPVTVVEPWLYHIIDDLAAHPFERDLPLTRAGGRSSLRLAIRLDDAFLGGLNFTSFQAARYTTADLAIGRRVADYVALALSHQRLAEEARENEALRARAANNELLDELLATVPDTADMGELLGRVSDIAKKVLPHDALWHAAVMPDGQHCRIHGAGAAAVPEMFSLPERSAGAEGDEYDIVDDLQADPAQRDLPSTRAGFRSTLRVSTRFAGKFDSAIAFLSFAPRAYKPADQPLARRFADRLALALSRERGVEARRRAEEATARAAELEARVRALTEELNARAGYRRVIGESREWHQALTQATQVAPTETTVLLLGESGTGKEVVARFVHGASRRSEGPFVALNCAALPEHLLEAELFGYERGAFTGATQSKPGQLEQAAGGTLFLDEVAEMSPSAQAKFLRVLQEREFQRLGGTRVLKTDARIVAATNRDLLKAMERGQFREDLYYRLNVFAIHLAPLRERRDDILPLAEAFVVEIGRSLGRPPAGVSRDAREALLRYHWPGNVRELRNVLERAAILADGGLITGEQLALRPPPATAPSPAAASPPAPVPEDVESLPHLAESARDLKDIERSAIEQALRQSRFNKSEAAKRLGLTRAQLYVRLRRYGLD
jgi:transcriptional regulator with GAF, ATPase, and Fis domain